MEDENTKKLTKILMGVVIVVMIIIVISLASTFSKTDYYGYDNKTTTTTTTKPINKTEDANTATKLIYNALFIDDDFLIPMNNIIKGKLELYDINLLQSDESRFIYIFSKLYKSSLTLEEINQESKEVFNYEINADLIKKYLTEEGYKYSYTKNYDYCFKLKNIKEDSSKMTITLDIINYNDEKCSIDNLEYDTIKRGVLIYNKSNNNDYIDSFALIKEED